MHQNDQKKECVNCVHCVHLNMHVIEHVWMTMQITNRKFTLQVNIFCAIENEECKPTSSYWKPSQVAKVTEQENWVASYPSIDEPYGKWQDRGRKETE